VGVFDPSDGFDNFGEPRLQLVQELEEVLRQLGHEADGAADRAEEDGASVRDAGVAEVLHDEAAVLEHVDVVADVDLADLRHLLPLLVELLDLVNGSNGDRGVRGKGQTVFVRLSVEGAHVLHLLQVDVAEDQLLVAAVDDGGPVAACEHVAHGAGR